MGASHNVKWRYRHWRASHYVHRAGVAYRRSPSSANFQRLARARDYLAYLNLIRDAR